jgi:hypothetical protein
MRRLTSFALVSMMIIGMAFAGCENDNGTEDGLDSPPTTENDGLTTE